MKLYSPTIAQMKLVLLVILTLSLSSPAQDLLPACQLALKACDGVVEAQKAQISLLEEEVATWKAEAYNTSGPPSIVVPMALGGAVSGGMVGGYGRGGQEALIGAITGAGVGAIMGLVIKGLVR